MLAVVALCGVYGAIGALLLREPPRPMQLLAIPLALLGLALIVGLDWQALPEDYRLGVIYGLATAVVYAGYLLSMRRSRQESSHPIPSREIAVISVIGAAILGASALFEGESLAVTTTTDAGWLVAYGILSHCLGLMFIASSLPHVSTTPSRVGFTRITFSRIAVTKPAISSTVSPLMTISPASLGLPRR